MENSMVVSPKIKNRAATWSTNSSKEYKKNNSKGHPYPYVPRSIIYNSQDTETTYTSIWRWMGKEGVAYK